MSLFAHVTKKSDDKLYSDPSEVDEEYMANIDERRNYNDIPDLGEDEVEAAMRKPKQRKAAGSNKFIIEERQAGTDGVGVYIYGNGYGSGTG